ncbi:MAG: NHL repeat-containing protein [Candidatus Krumholzibacteriia bacterium]
MRRFAPVLTALAVISALAVALPGCVPAPGARAPRTSVDGAAPAPAPAPAPATTGDAEHPVPQRLDFLYQYANDRTAPYYPLEGVGGVAYASDGTLFLCDEKGGRVHGCAGGTGEWFQFDTGPEQPFRPVDVRVDGFTVLVLDYGSRLLLRYESGGALLDRLLSFRNLDATRDRLPVAFDVDRDGRIVCADAGAEQIVLLDSFLNLSQVLGEPGTHREQFLAPSGVVFRADGGFVVADRGNRRLQWYNRLGYFEGVVGGEFDPRNVLLTPQGLATDAYGDLFVADPAAGAVHVFGPDLTLLFSAGSELGLLAGPEEPLDVAVGPDDLLAVSDRGRQAVLVYRIVYD